MSYLANLAVGERGGLPRVWIQSKALAREGFEAGKPIEVDTSDRERIVIRVCEDGTRVVSKKTSRGNVTPLIELRNQALSDWLPKHAKRVQVHAANGTIEIIVHKDDEAAKSRLDALKERLKTGKPLRIGEVCVGGGILSDAAHEGLSRAGVKSEISFAIECENAYLDQFMKTSRGITKNTLITESRMEEVDLSLLPKVDMLIGSLPCTGASKAGRSANKIKMAEQHSSSGVTFWAYLNVIKNTNPSIVQLENVCEWADTASQAIIRGCLEQWGYNVHEGTVGRELGAFEKRNRFAMIAVTKGLPAFDFDSLVRSAPTPAKLGDILEAIPEDDASWKAYNYIFEKEKRDIAAGKGFKTQIVTPESPSVGVIPRHYAKVQTTNPLLKHPTKDLYRLLTPVEHARAKSVPLRLIEGLSVTQSHQQLGQSVLYSAFDSVFKAMGDLLTGNKPNIVTVPVRKSKRPEASVGLLPPKTADRSFGQLSLL